MIETGIKRRNITEITYFYWWYIRNNRNSSNEYFELHLFLWKQCWIEISFRIL